MIIQIKTGICIDCNNSNKVPLIAKRCQFHYKVHRNKVNTQKAKDRAGNEPKTNFPVYFANQALKMPLRCEESGLLLPTQPAWLKLACCAHILPKRKRFGFPSVSEHPQNMIYLHPDIHGNMDNFGEEYILQMKSLLLMKERVAILYPLLTDEEKKRVPHYFL